MEINQIVMEQIAGIELVNIVDVGCARGALMKEVVLPKRELSSVFSVGIDPLNHGVGKLYSKYLQCGIDDIGDSKFRIKRFYVNKDDQASSLMQMDVLNLSENKLDTEKIYVPWASRLAVKFVIPIKVLSLESVFRKYFYEKKIHFLKIDAEGNDLRVLRSQKFENRPVYITAETSSHRNSNVRVFKNGSEKSELISFMRNHGYSIFHITNYVDVLANGTQMSDILFKDNNVSRL